MGITAEFAKLGARLVNNQWAVSALTANEMVASLWFHRLKTENGQLVYRDYLGRWSGHGNRLFAKHLSIAVSDQRPVRLVIAKTDDVDLIESGGDGSKAKKTDYGWSFATAARLVEADPDERTDACNAIALTEAQIQIDIAILDEGIGAAGVTRPRCLAQSLKCAARNSRRPDQESAPYGA